MDWTRKVNPVTMKKVHSNQLLQWFRSDLRNDAKSREMAILPILSPVRLPFRHTGNEVAQSLDILSQRP